MSRHYDVECDYCKKSGYDGIRYKCLVCYDYDLCATCFKAGATSVWHETKHPMQPISTQLDLCEPVRKKIQFTCPFCGKMGLTDPGLRKHVKAKHAQSTIKVMCPICITKPGTDPNPRRYVFLDHIALKHTKKR